MGYYIHLLESLNFLDIVITIRMEMWMTGAVIVFVEGFGLEAYPKKCT